jgi:hypothetical protein
MFKVSDFITHFNKHSDFAKTSKFEVLIAPPPFLSDLSTYDLRFQCESTELPGYNVNTVENRQYGVGSPVASAPVAFADITLTFICAGDMWEKKLFDRWMNNVIPINNYNPRYKEEYVTSKIEINQYSEVADTANMQSQKIYSAILFSAFPISIGALSLNWADDGIHRLPITFKYDYWLPGNFNPAKPQSQQSGRETPNGSTPPITGDRGQPVRTVPSAPRAVNPLPPFSGRGGRFAGGGASGSF